MLETVSIVLLGAAVIVYLYLSHRYNYWRNRGVPQPPVVFGFGNILDAVFVKSNIGLVFDKIYRTNKGNDAVGIYHFLIPKLLLRNPDLIRRVMISDFSSFHDNEFFVTKKTDPHFYMDPFNLKGEEWKISRAKLVPALTTIRMKEIFPFLKEAVQRLDTYLVENLGKDLEAKSLATLFTMDNVSNTVFGISSNCFSDPNSSFHKMADMIMKEQLQSWWRTMILFHMPAVRDFLGYQFTPTKVSNYLEKMVADVMEFRKKSDMNRNDLFQYFLKKGPGDNLDEILFYATTFFFEGFETSSMVASMTLYELALNSDIQETLYEELKSLFETQPDMNYESINNLQYLDKVIQEIQRKYPVMFAYVRECTKPVTFDIDGKSVDIEVGTPVIVPVFSIHNDPQYYPEPEVFNPERFSEESKAARPPQTYMPFGDGPRICPGIKFGLIQVKVFISHILYTYKVMSTSKTPSKLTISPSAFMVVPNEELWIRIERRK